MKMCDLKSGMVVELRDGRKKLVLESKLRPFLIDLQHYQSTCDYDKNMVNLLESKTINKVYEITSAANLADLLNGKSLNLIWERKPKPKEMTMEELEKTLGYPIKIVKEKEKSSP